MAGHYSAAYMDAYNRGLASCNSNNNNSQPNTQSDTAGKPLLCWAAGGVVLLGGVPAPAVMAADQQAHNAEICP